MNTSDLLQQIDAGVNALVRKAADPMPAVLVSNEQEIVIDILQAKLIFPYSQLNHALSYLDPLFDSGIRHFMIHNCLPGMLYVDVGANAGVMAAIAARCVGAAGKVITIDPLEGYADNIARNVFLNAPMVPHEHIQCAVAAQDGSMVFNVIPGDTRSATLYSYEDRAHPQSVCVEVPVRRLSTIIPPGSMPLFIKIDAEGAEYEILGDIFDNPACLSGRDVVLLFEYGSDHNHRAGHGGDAILRLLESHGLAGRFIHPSSGVYIGDLDSGTVHQDGNVVVTIAASHFPATVDRQSDPALDLANALRAIIGRPSNLSEITCRICGYHASAGAFAPVIATCMFSGEPLHRHRCPSCDLIFGPIPLIDARPEELADLYRLLYRTYQEGDSWWAQEKAFYSLNPATNKRYLNYASGDSRYGLGHLRKSGWNVVGFEPFQHNPCDFIIQDRTLLEKSAFDGLFSNNYLEHTQDPVEFLKECAALLKEGGRMAHSTPCYSYLFENSPFHLYFFEGRSVAAMCTAAGLVEIGSITSDFTPDRLGYRFECRLFDVANMAD